jgi:hypothetical protein
VETPVGEGVKPAQAGCGKPGQRPQWTGNGGLALPQKGSANMKWTHILAIIGLEIGALPLFTGLPHVGGPLLLLAMVCHMVYAALTGKQSNDGMR